MVSPHYDPMLAKVIAHAPTRTRGRLRPGRRAGRRPHPRGHHQPRPAGADPAPSRPSVAGDTDTGFLDRHGSTRWPLRWPTTPPPAVTRWPPPWPPRRPAGPSPGAADHPLRVPQQPVGAAARHLRRPRSGWCTVGYRFDRFDLTGRPLSRLEIDGAPGRCRCRVDRPRTWSPSPPGASPAATGVETVSATSFVDGPDGARCWSSTTGSPTPEVMSAAGSSLAPMPGGVVRVAVAVGDEVKPGQLLVVLEAMKMEHAVHAAAAGQVERGDVSVGDQVETGRVLVVAEGWPGQRSDRGPVRIANCSGFYGDRLSAAREMVDGGPIDFLTGDWLAELTMLILWKGRRRDATKGWARTFLTQMEEVLGTCADRGIKVVTNAGGLNPAGLADQVRLLADRLGMAVSVAHVEGDDLIPGSRTGQARATRSPISTPAAPGRGQRRSRHAPTPTSGAGPSSRPSPAAPTWSSVPRITDASLVVGPGGLAPSAGRRPTGTAWPGRWWPATSSSAGPRPPAATTPSSPRCPGSSTPASRSPRWPRTARRSSPSTPGTGGEVSVGTVTAQLLYEIGGPHYANPDVVARFDTIALAEDGPDRVGSPGVRGDPAPERSRSPSTCWAVGATP